MAENNEKEAVNGEQPDEALPEETAAPDAGTAEEEKPETEENPQERIEALEKQLAEEKEKYLRLDAEYYNYRTRSVKEKQEAYDKALVDTVAEILPVIDNFERAIGSECSDANFKKGVDMIFKQYLAILDKLGVKEIEAEGSPFDPNFHNAVSQVEDENLGENIVAAVLQKGYTAGGKVIRHAMVTVANP